MADINDLGRLILDGDVINARRAREREIDTLIATAVAMTSRLDLEDLLAEIARQVTSVFNCTYCLMFEHDSKGHQLRLLAEYDSKGSHISHRAEPRSQVFALADWPLSRQVLEDRTIALVDINDPDADPAERRTLVRDGDVSLAMVPMIYKDEAIGTIELIDSRSRSYTPQDQRLMRSMAALAAVALINARVYQASRLGEDGHGGDLPLHELAASFPAALRQPDLPSMLGALAKSVCGSFRAVSCVASLDGSRASATGASLVHQEESPVVVEGCDRSGATSLVLTVTLPGPAHAFAAEMLDVLAGSAGALILRLRASATLPTLN